MYSSCFSFNLQVPNISRSEYTLLDINEEGFVSSLLTAAIRSQHSFRNSGSSWNSVQCPGLRTVHSTQAAIAGDSQAVWQPKKVEQP
jgi:hypothetical protein